MTLALKKDSVIFLCNTNLLRFQQCDYFSNIKEANR
jgi:hypothetical protein